MPSYYSDNYTRRVGRDGLTDQQRDLFRDVMMKYAQYVQDYTTVVYPSTTAARAALLRILSHSHAAVATFAAAGLEIFPALLLDEIESALLDCLLHGTEPPWLPALAARAEQQAQMNAGTVPVMEEEAP